MNISEIKKAEWIPKEHRLIYNFSETEFWGSLMCSIFFTCLTALAFIYGTKTDNFTPVVASLIVTIILVLYALGANEQRGFKTVLNQDGVCTYRHDEIIRLIKYDEIAYIEKSTKAPDKDTIYYSKQIKTSVRLKRMTIDLYNNENKLLTRLTLEPTVELIIVLLMLIKHNPSLKSSLSIADGKDIAKYVESRKSTYEQPKNKE